MINKDNLKLFWYFIDERHQVYLNKQAGMKKPWTSDPILQNYKFTNIFRELDTGTVWLRKHFIEPHLYDYDLLLFNIAWYRLFNLVSTGQLLGYQTEYDEKDAIRQLDILYDRGENIFTSAHMTRGIKGERKYVSNCRIITEIWNARREITLSIDKENTIEHAAQVFRKFDLIGPFISYEIATDLRHTNLLHNAKDIMTWANPGPGAKRGLDRIFDDVFDNDDAIARMRDLLEMSKTRMGSHVPPLELRDVEHTCCEFSKYAKIYYGEGRTRCKYDGR